MADDLERLARLLARLEGEAPVDHDTLIELNARFDEWRLAHRDVHNRDDHQREADYKELQRRLDVLNHAHEEARTKEAEFASKDEVDVAFGDRDRQINKLTSDLSGLFNQVQNLAQTSAGAVAGKSALRALVYSIIGTVAAAVIVAVVLSLKY